MGGGGVGGGDSVGKPKKGGRRRSAARDMPEEDPEFQIAPMIDVLLVLMVFFMSITTADILQAKKGLILPVAKNSLQKQKAAAGEGVINVEPAGRGMKIFLGDQPVANPEQLTLLLKTKVDAAPKDAKGRSSFTVRIRGDKSLRYESVRLIMIACGNAGIDKIKYSVTSRDQDPAPGGQP